MAQVSLWKIYFKYIAILNLRIEGWSNNFSNLSYLILGDKRQSDPISYAMCAFNHPDDKNSIYDLHRKRNHINKMWFQLRYTHLKQNAVLTFLYFKYLIVLENTKVFDHKFSNLGSSIPVSNLLQYLMVAFG